MRAFVSLLFLVGAVATAQPVTIPPAGSGAISGGGPASDVGERVAVSPFTGERAVVGTFEQTATFGGVSVTSADAPAGRSDAFVVFYGADGTALWARRMGTDVFNDFGAGVALASDFDGTTRVYVSGFFTGIATFDGGTAPDATLTTRSDFDAFLAAYDGTGDLLWVQQAGGVDQDTGRDVVADDFGGVFWAGSFTGTATWGSGGDAVTRTSAGSSDGFLARYESDGTLDWLLTTGGSEGDDLRGLALGGFGDALYATGTFRGIAFFGDVPFQSRGLSDVAVLSINPTDGTPLWTRQVGGSGNEYARGVAATFEAVAVAGSFENDILVGTDVLTSAGFSDAFAAFYTPDGTERGAVRGGGAGFDIANGVAATPALPIPVRVGTPSAPVFAVTGYVDGASTFGATPLAAQGLDAFAAVYVDETPDGPAPMLGALLRFGASNADRGAGAAIGSTSGPTGSQFGTALFLTGSFRDVVTFGDSTVTGVGSNDVFLATVPLCPEVACYPAVSTAEAPTGGLLLTIAPNPSLAGARLTLTLAAATDATVEVEDALGRVVARLHRGPLAAGETAWTAPPLAPGAYWLVARTGGRTVRQAFTVVR